MQLQQYESTNRLQSSDAATRTHTKYPQLESIGMKVEDESNVMSSSSDEERYAG